MLANLENSAVVTGLEKDSFHFNLKERQCQRMFKLPYTYTHANKVMLRIFQARLQQYLNQELSDVQAGLRKGKGSRDQIVCWIMEKAREFQKNTYFCFTLKEISIHWKDWCQTSRTLATWCEELAHWKRPWCWERRRVGEGGDGGLDGWIVSLTQWIRVWASSGR